MTAGPRCGEHPALAHRWRTRPSFRPGEADHRSPWLGSPDGSYGGNPAGFLLILEGKKIYHACDPGLFYDMKLTGEEGLDVAILPIGDNFTMGPDDAIRAVKLLEPEVVIPIHNDTFDVLAQDPKAFAARVGAETAAQCVVLQPGDTYRV